MKTASIAAFTLFAAKIEGYFVRLLEGPGSARRLLQAEL